jgi:lipoate-protein ligase A
MRRLLNLLVLENYPILEQLRLEEALLRAGDENWCILNSGTEPAIVMGISAKPEEVVNLELLKSQPVPLIRRYSGGGTVFVDRNTFFASLILNHEVTGRAPYPKEIMDWSAELYQNMPFQIRENDYVIEDRKCGGNAQYFTKNRLVHHTSFLWDYSPDQMEYLKQPPKMPSYRKNRTHESFLCTLKEHFSHMPALNHALIAVLAERFELLHRSLDEAIEVLEKEHRKATLLCQEI